MAAEIHNALSTDLKIAQLKHTLDNATKSLQEFTKLAEGSQELREWATNEITRYALSIRASKLDKDELENFFKYPYCILPGKHEGECYLAIPKFVDAHFGWLHKVTASFNIFLVNRYVDWLGELPQALKKEMKFTDPLDVHLDGEYVVGPDAEKVYNKHPSFFTKQKDGRLLIDKSRHFEMLAGLIKDGILPFVPKPVPKSEMTNRKCDFQLRDYQQEAYDEYLKYSNVGIFYPPSTGKTYFGIHALTHQAGPHIVVVPSKLLVEQWIERIELYTDLKVTNNIRADGYEVYVTTYQSGIKSDRKYKLKVIDEVHHLPANEFSKLSSVNSEYTIGLSATPQREDSREEYIFALTGKPIGLSWDKFKELKIIQNPTMHVWIVKNEIDRIKQLGNLLNEDLKTIVFSDSIEMGKIVSKRFNLPHIHGSSKDRLAAIKEAQVSVVSRVGDEGVSLSDIKRVIEISWLHGSRRQELQRFTRVLHGKGNDGEAHIIMTGLEYQQDHKRLFGLMDHNFKIVLHRDGEEDKTVEGSSIPRQEHVTSRLRIRKEVPDRNFKVSKKVIEDSTLDEIKYPALKFPGIKKIVTMLSKKQKTLMLFLLEPQNKDTWFTIKQLARHIGYATPNSLYYPDLLPYFLEKEYVIKNAEGMYKQNFGEVLK